MRILIVEDHGPGIPPAERERVFERFRRVLGSGTLVTIAFPRVA